MTKKNTKDSKTKAPTKPAAIRTKAKQPNKDLYKFLLDNAGGEEAAMKSLAVNRVNNLPKGTTLREAFDLADSEGWSPMLEAMTLGDLRGTVKAPSKPKTRKPRGSAEAMRKGVMVALSGSKGTPLPARKIAEIIGEGTDPRAVGRALSDLVKSGAVVRTGSKRDSKYSAA